jgi:transcriptional regulator with XRE-family HTH domain
MPPVPTVAPNSSEIQEIREERGLTRPALARIIGCNPQTVWNVECKSIRVSKTMLSRFAIALGVKVARITLAEPAEPKAQQPASGAAA